MPSKGRLYKPPEKEKPYFGLITSLGSAPIDRTGTGYTCFTDLGTNEPDAAINFYNFYKDIAAKEQVPIEDIESFEEFRQEVQTNKGYLLPTRETVLRFQIKHSPVECLETEAELRTNGTLARIQRKDRKHYTLEYNSDTRPVFHGTLPEVIRKCCIGRTRQYSILPRALKETGSYTRTMIYTECRFSIGKDTYAVYLLGTGLYQFERISPSKNNMQGYLGDLIRIFSESYSLEDFKNMKELENYG